MKLPAKSPVKKRNLAAKALRSPLFREKLATDPKAYKRVKKVVVPQEDDENN